MQPEEHAEARSESAPQSEARPGGPIAGGERPRGFAYTPKPETPRRGPRAAWYAVAGLAVLAAAFAGWRLAHLPQRLGSPQGIVAPVAEAKQEKILLVSTGDLDRKATERARAMLSAGEIPPELASAGPEVRAAVGSGQMGLLTLRMLDFAAVDGDVIDVSVEGKVLGRIALDHTEASLTIPLKVGRDQSLKISAVHDGGGGVTFAARSSVGEIRTRVMGVGESDVWTVSFR